MKAFLTLYWKKYFGFEGSKLLIPSGDPQHGILLVFQAHSPQDLSDLIEKQRDFLENNKLNLTVSDPDVFTTHNDTESEYSENYENLNCPKISKHQFRAAFTASGFPSLYDKLVAHSLTETLETQKCSNLKTASNSSVGMLFTGQGSQYHGMAQELYKTSQAFRKGFDTASNLLKDQYGIKLKDVVYGDRGHLLDTSLYSQTSIFCLEIGMLSFWQSFGVKPSSVLGPSAGGFAAAVAANVVTLEQGAWLVGGRAKLINALPAGGMTAVDGGEVKVQALIDQMKISTQSQENWLDIAVINSEKDVVVAGRPYSLEAFEELCSSKRVRATRLKAKQAFHSREIDSISEEYKNMAIKIMDKSISKEIPQPHCKYISGIDGTVMCSNNDFSPEYWLSHARARVDLPKAVKSLWNQGARVFIEVGPRPVLIHDAKEILGRKKASKALWIASMSKQDYESNTTSWTTILEGIGSLFEAGIIEFSQIK